MNELTHEVTTVKKGCWCISEFKLVNAFLVEGTDKALLIDTGCGIGNIRKVVEELTNKEIVVALTHCHPDHDGGMFLFPDKSAYMSPDDCSLYDEKWAAPTNNFRRLYIETRVPVRFPGEGHIEALKEMVPKEEPACDFRWVPIYDGDSIDIGGANLLVLATPGHSDGSICYLDSLRRILFSGDTVNRSTILMRQQDGDLGLVRQFEQSLKKIWEHKDDFDVLAIGHDGITVPKQLVKDYLVLTSRLLGGGLTGEYEEGGIRKGNVVRHGLAELWYQCDE